VATLGIVLAVIVALGLVLGAGAVIGLIYLINFLVASATAFFAPAELTAIPRIVDRRHLMTANSMFVLTINATFAIGFQATLVSLLSRDPGCYG